MITILFQENDGSTSVGQSTLEAWASEFGLTIPVLGDQGEANWSIYNYSYQRPSYVVIDRNMIIQNKGAGTGFHNSLDGYIEGLL